MVIDRYCDRQTPINFDLAAPTNIQSTPGRVYLILLSRLGVLFSFFQDIVLFLLSYVIKLVNELVFANFHFLNKFIEIYIFRKFR